MIKYGVNAISVHSLTWGLILNVRLQTAQKLHILDDLGNSVLNNRWNAHQRRRTKIKIIQFFLSYLIRNLKCMQPPHHPGFTPCAHNPAGMSQIWDRLHLVFLALPGSPATALVTLLAKEAEAPVEARQLLLDRRSASISCRIHWADIPSHWIPWPSAIRKKMATVTEASMKHFIRQSYIFINIGDEALSFYWEF